MSAQPQQEPPLVVPRLNLYLWTACTLGAPILLLLVPRAGMLAAGLFFAGGFLAQNPRGTRPIGLIASVTIFLVLGIANLSQGGMYISRPVSGIALVVLAAFAALCWRRPSLLLPPERAT
jgi:hypothetical protein